MQAARGRTARPEEVAVAAAFLADRSDARAGKLLAQLTESHVVQRSRPARDRFEVTLASVPEVVELARPVESGWVTLHDATTSQRLELRVRLLRGGFFGALEGRAPDGRWPKRWRINEAELQAVEPLRLPRQPSSNETLAQLRAWLGLPAELEGGRVSGFEAAGTDDLDAAERQAESPLPASYRDLAAITDGLEMTEQRSIYGVADVYVTDIDEVEWWILGEVGDAEFLVGRPGQEEILRWLHDAKAPTRLAHDLAAYVAAAVFKQR